MVFGDASPSSPTAGFLNKVTIPCPNNSYLDLLSYLMVSSWSLDSAVTVLLLGINPFAFGSS